MKPEEVIRHYNALKEDYLSRRSFMVRERIDEISKEVISILEKQIGKKPIIFDCCECGNTVSERLDNGDFPLELEYCPYCGQKQDWSEEE